ncbi:hypothetical protein Syun_015324 [Stephania yunnanensis]|uniref:Uncharacterized protein n=1 Tax=Stephania yunnanensis TaxID=152371 RepID=A0AAP0JLG6_9MAGN
MEREMDPRRTEEETAHTSSGIITTAGLPVAEPRLVEWTDEKHSLYLNHMETSFVRKLYNHEYCSAGSHSWKPKRKNMLDPNSWQKSNANNGNSDHNFVNEENGEGQSSRVGRSKKAKTVDSDVLENDQVVPVGKSPDKRTACSVQQSEKIAYQESESPISLDGGKRMRVDYD